MPPLEASVSRMKPKDPMMVPNSVSKLRPVELSFCLVMADCESQIQFRKPAVEARHGAGVVDVEQGPSRRVDVVQHVRVGVVGDLPFSVELGGRRTGVPSMIGGSRSTGWRCTTPFDS